MGALGWVGGSLARGGRADDAPAEGAGTPTPVKPAANGTSRLEATFAAVREGGGESLGEHLFRVTLTVKNPGNETLRIRTGNLLLRSEGGWLTPLDPPALAGTFLEKTELLPGKDLPVERLVYKVCGPAHDALLLLDADDGRAAFCTPLVAEGAEASVPCTPPMGALGLGLLGPLEAVRYSDGRRSIVVVGQLQSLGAGTLSDIQASLLVATDAGGGQPAEWSGGVGDGVGPGLWPYLKRIDVDNAFTNGVVSVRVRARLDGKPVLAALDLPAKSAESWICAAPVLGAWQLGNGPAERLLHGNLLHHKSRYAWDFVVTVDGRTRRTDATGNESYHAWNKSVRAVADGEVVEVENQKEDRSGVPGSTAACLRTPANRVILRHEGGVYTAYLHTRQGSIPATLTKGARVKAGDVIARVGNSGYSSEPHLHFFAFRLAPDGTLTPVPVAFANAFADPQGKQPVVGVPVGGSSVHFLDPKSR